MSRRRRDRGRKGWECERHRRVWDGSVYLWRQGRGKGDINSILTWEGGAIILRSSTAEPPTSWCALGPLMSYLKDFIFQSSQADASHQFHLNQPPRSSRLPIAQPTMPMGHQHHSNPAAMLMGGGMGMHGSAPMAIMGGGMPNPAAAAMAAAAMSRQLQMGEAAATGTVPSKVLPRAGRASPARSNSGGSGLFDALVMAATAGSAPPDGGLERGGGVAGPSMNTSRGVLGTLERTITGTSDFLMPKSGAGVGPGLTGMVGGSTYPYASMAPPPGIGGGVNSGFMPVRPSAQQPAATGVQRMHPPPHKNRSRLWSALSSGELDSLQVWSGVVPPDVVPFTALDGLCGFIFDNDCGKFETCPKPFSLRFRMLWMRTSRAERRRSFPSRLPAWPIR